MLRSSGEGGTASDARWGASDGERCSLGSARGASQVLGKKCEGRKEYTSMVAVANDFWTAINDDEIKLEGKRQLPKLTGVCVEKGVGDDDDANPPPRGRKGKPSTVTRPYDMAKASIFDSKIDPRAFEAKGFKVNAFIKPSSAMGKPSRDADCVLKIVKIEDQTVTLQSEDGTTEKQMSELMDCYVLRVEDETKVVVLFFLGGGGGVRRCWMLGGRCSLGETRGGGGGGRGRG